MTMTLGASLLPSKAVNAPGPTSGPWAAGRPGRYHR